MDILSLTTPIPHLRARYKKICLVSHQRHLSQEALTDSDILYISSDWLLWQDQISRKRHCAYLEHGLLSDHDPGSLETDIMAVASKWIAQDGNDPSIYRGVSLVRQFLSEVTVFVGTFYRLYNSLRFLIEKYRPEQIVFRDIRLQDQVLVPHSIRRLVVETAAKDYGLPLIDQFDPSEPNDAQCRPGNAFESKRYSGLELRRALVNLYICCGHAISSAREFLAPRQRRVLMMTGWNLLGQLLPDKPQGVRIFIAAAHAPKTWNLLNHALSDDIFLGRLTRPCHGVEDDEFIERLIGIYNEMQPPADGLARVVFDYFRQRILQPSRLKDMASHVKSWELFLERHRIDRIVVDGVRNPPATILIELAAAKGIPVDYIWHSPWSPQNVKFPYLGCKDFEGPLVTRILSWGDINDEWIDATGVSVPSLRVGSPLANARESRPKSAIQSTSAMILQMNVNFLDLKGLIGEQFYWFIFAAKTLQKKGYEKLVLKMHPGVTLDTEYYRDLCDQFDIDCEIYKKESLEELVEHIDIAVGPVQSGSVIEVLCAHKDFFGLLLGPSTVDPTYFDGQPLIRRIEDLPRAIDDHQVLERETYLDRHCGRYDGSTPAEKFWAAVT